MFFYVVLLRNTMLSGPCIAQPGVIMCFDTLLKIMIYPAGAFLGTLILFTKIHITTEAGYDT
jgi:hypothetical protein